MNIQILFIIFLLLNFNILSIAQFNNQEDNQIQEIDLLFNFQFNNPQIKTTIIDSKTYQSISISNLDQSTNENKPSIPVKSISILLPPNSKFTSYELESDERIIKLTKPLLKNGKSLPINTDLSYPSSSTQTQTSITDLYPAKKTR